MKDDKPSGDFLSPAESRKSYRPPRLITFGKLHTLVAAGSGPQVEFFRLPWATDMTKQPRA